MSVKEKTYRMKLLFQDRVPQEVISKIIERSSRLPIDENWFMFLSDFESGLDAYRVNPYSCRSYIQFCADFSGGDYKTIKGKRYYFSEMEKMTPVQLIDLSFDYLEEQQDIHGRFSTYHDLYFSILFPIAIGKPDDYVLNTKSNPIFDINKNGSITVGEVKQFLDNRVRAKVPSAYLDTFFKKKTFCSYINEKLSSGAGLRLAS